MTKEANKIKAIYFKSCIGYSQDQKDTIKTLGFKKLGQTREFADNKVLRGMITKVKHLVRIEVK